MCVNVRVLNFFLILSISCSIFIVKYYKVCYNFDRQDFLILFSTAMFMRVQAYILSRTARIVIIPYIQHLRLSKFLKWNQDSSLSDPVTKASLKIAIKIQIIFF